MAVHILRRKANLLFGGAERPARLPFVWAARI